MPPPSGFSLDSVYVYHWRVDMTTLDAISKAASGHAAYRWQDLGWMWPSQAQAVAATDPFGYFYDFGSFASWRSDPPVVMPLGRGIMTGHELISGGYFVVDVGSG